jgi:MFS transporter, OFA family, oxalate/formate antiporter
MIFNPIVAVLTKTYSPKILVAIGSAIAVSAPLLSTQVHTFQMFLVSFAMVLSVGVSFCYFPPLVAGWQWLPERKGLVTGIILGAFGLGSFIFSLISIAVVNPQNASPTVLAPNGSMFFDATVAARVPLLLYVLAGTWAILAIPAVLLIRNKPNSNVAQTVTAITNEELTFGEGIKEHQLHLLLAMDMCSVFTFIYMASVYKTIGIQVGGLDDYTLTVIGSLGGLANGISRMVWG